MPPETVQVIGRRMTRKAAGMRPDLSCFAFALVTIQLIAGLAWGQTPTAEEPIPPPSRSNLHRWGALTLFHGLPSNQVRAIAADQDGTMWFGTDAGLARYDGRRIQRFAAAGPARIRALQFDSSGTLWVGTDKGASLLRDGSLITIPETSEKVITAIITPAANRAVIASLEGMIFDCVRQPNGVVTVRAMTPTDYPSLRIDAERPVPLTSLAFQHGALLIGTSSRGLLKIDAFLTSTGTVEIKEVVSRPRLFFVETLALDPANLLWYGGQTAAEDSGLYKAEELSRPEKISFGLGTVRAIAFDQRGKLWSAGARGAAMIEDGLVRERLTFENTAGGLRSNEVYAISIDREGVVWFGTDRGVCRYDPRSLALETISPAPESNFVRVIYRGRDGHLWGGTNRGLWLRDDGGWREIAGLDDRAVHTINEDTSGRMLVGAAGGLYALNPHTGEMTRLESTVVNESIRAIANFRGAVYVANFGRGLERLDGEKRSLVWSGSTQVVSLYAEGDARLWIGTADSGVYAFDGSNTARESSLNVGNIGNEAAIWSIRGTREKGLWLATSRGLFLSRNQKLIPLIMGSDVRAVVVDDASEPGAWCALAPGGLSRVRLDPIAGPVVARFDVEKGLLSPDAFALVAEGAAEDELMLLIGTSRGLAVYRPSAIAPQLRLVRALGRRLYEPSEFRVPLPLEYPQNSLALDFAAAASRTFPEQFQYAFRVRDGSGREIVERLSGDSQLLLENLGPGRYRVEARAFNIDLLVSSPLALEFEVARAPFPWISVTLAGLLALALGAVWWGARQNRRLVNVNDALAAANQQLAETRLQLANETETERRRIARDLHDQTLADLRRLLLLTDRLPPNEAQDGLDPAIFRREIEGVSTEIRRICEDLSPSVLANVGLIAALEWALAGETAHLPAAARPELEFKAEDGLEEELTFTPATQIQIYRVAQEAVSNICRHAHPKWIKMSVEIDESEGFVLSIEDDGRSFDPEREVEMKTGHGLNNIRTRASLIDARVEWKVRPEGGTVFSLIKPSVRPANFVTFASGPAAPHQ
jgi:signal transduction histidine kinase/ligand-binding sensor domain-containing protein